jgi:hypothetical protein
VLDGSYYNIPNRAISQASVALGAASIAGLKGWYYNYIDYNTKQVYLTDTQPTSQSSSKPSTDTLFSSGYDIGDVISLVADGKFENAATITGVNGNVLTLDSIPFTSTPAALSDQIDEYSIYCLAKFDVGGCDLGKGSFAEGVNTRAINTGAHAGGNHTVVDGACSIGHGSHVNVHNSYAAAFGQHLETSADN